MVGGVNSETSPYIYNAKLLYLGITERKIEERWSEHLDYTIHEGLESSQQKYLYKNMMELKRSIITVVKNGSKNYSIVLINICKIV